MQKIICKKLYDTDASEIIKKVTYGNFGGCKSFSKYFCMLSFSKT